MTVKTTLHQCDCGVSYADAGLCIKVQQNSPNHLECHNITKSRRECLRTIDLENGGKYANITQPNNPIWGCRFKGGARLVARPDPFGGGQGMTVSMLTAPDTNKAILRVEMGRQKFW